MAKVQVRPNGLLHFDFRYRGKRCREYTKLQDSPTNRRRMQAILDKIDAEIMMDTFDYARYFPNSPRALKFSGRLDADEVTLSDSPSFDEFAELWFSENEVRWKLSYTKCLRGTLDNYLIPAFVDKRVDEVTREDILAFRAKLARPNRHGERRLSNDRVNHILTPLRMILEEAAARFKHPNPWVLIKPLKAESTDVQPFSLDEVRLIIDNVREDFRDYYLVRFFTGLRTGEIDGLQWEYVDFERRIIAVRKTIVQGREETPKTQGSVRDVAMSQPVVDALSRQFSRTGHLSKFVFCSRSGNSLSHRNVTQRVWYPILRRLGLKERRPYQTRHTAATLWLAAGEAPEWIARQLGHSTTRMLFTVYSRYVPNLTRNDGSAMEQLLSTRFGGGDND